MDTVMSHITHLYHLSAPDFIDFTATSLVPMSPWTPSYTAGGGVVMVDGALSTLRQSLILNYVDALRVRRLVHTAGALFSGRQPIQNAIVPGGVTTLWDQTYPLQYATTDYDKFGPYNIAETRSKFSALLTTIRTFIDTKYIPDVLTVATYFSSYWTQGVGCKTMLSFGEYPMDTSGTLLIKRGVKTDAAGAIGAFDQALIVEQVNRSWYDYPALDALLATNGRHPFDGVTVPNIKAGTTYYSWLKAPRYGTAATVYEVGPLARIWVSYNGDNVQTARSLNQVGTLLANGTYNVSGLVGVVLTAAGHGSSPGRLFSALGRHAARAAEAKLLADACVQFIDLLPATNTSCYTYKKIQKQIATGVGLAEAPRGALGHWIKIEGRKIAKYQCVVPSTWNFSPRDANGIRGPVEQSLVNSDIGTSTNAQIVNILRIVHPFDCCIACAVHVVSPDGKEKLRFSIDPDGRPANIVETE